MRMCLRRQKYSFGKLERQVNAGNSSIRTHLKELEFWGFVEASKHRKNNLTRQNGVLRKQFPRKKCALKYLEYSTLHRERSGHRHYYPNPSKEAQTLLFLVTSVKKPSNFWLS